MKKFFFIFIFILFFRQGFCASGLSYTVPGGGSGLPQLKTGAKNYSTDFMTKLRYIAAMISSYYQYANDFNPVVKIPVAVKIGNYYDLVLFGFKYPNFNSQSGYCYNSGSNVITYYIYSNYDFPTVKAYIPYAQQNSNPINFWCSQSAFPLAASSSLSNLMAVPGRLSASGVYSGVNYSKNYTLYVYANSGQIRDTFYNNIIPSNYVSTDTILGSYDKDLRNYYFLNLSTDIPHWSDNDISNAFINENPYQNIPFVIPSPSDITGDGSNPVDVSSTSIYYISYSTTIINIDLSTTNLLLTQIRDKINFSTITSVLTDIRDRISTSPVSVDLSTTNKYLKGLYDVWADTSVVVTTATIIGGEVLDSVSQTTSTIMAIYDDIKNFFSVTFPTSTVWNCHFDFGQISFLNKNYILGDYDLCSEPPEGLGLLKYFNLLKLIIRLLFVALSIEVMIKGWINAL